MAVGLTLSTVAALHSVCCSRFPATFHGVKAAPPGLLQGRIPAHLVGIDPAVHHPCGLVEITGAARRLALARLLGKFGDRPTCGSFLKRHPAGLCHTLGSSKRSRTFTLVRALIGQQQQIMETFPFRFVKWSWIANGSAFGFISEQRTNIALRIRVRDSADVSTR